MLCCHLSCSWEMLQELGSDHLPILLTVPLSPVFRLNERPPSFNFQKTCWDDFAFYFDSHCPSEEEYSSLYFSAAALFTFLTSNAVKFSIFLAASKNADLKPGGPPKWKKQLVKDVRLSPPLIEAIMIFRLISPVPDGLRLSSLRLRQSWRLALLFHLNLCTLSFVLSLDFLPLLISPSILLPGSRLLSADYLRFKPKALCSRPRGYLSELRRPTCS